MTLRDEGYRFCISPGKERARWVHPVERRKVCQDWVDVTDWPDEKLAIFLMPEPVQHDLFAA